MRSLVQRRAGLAVDEIFWWDILFKFYLGVGLTHRNPPLAVHLLAVDDDTVTAWLFDVPLYTAVTWLFESCAAHRHARRCLVAAATGVKVYGSIKEIFAQDAGCAADIREAISSTLVIHGVHGTRMRVR